MGTLSQQPAREHHAISQKDLEAFLSLATDLAKKHGIEVSVVIEAAKVLQMERRNDLSVNAGDIFDEQLAGFGDILNDIAHALKDVAIALERQADNV